jgi:RNA polymerase sigma-70 factor (ECF subfamily)
MLSIYLAMLESENDQKRFEKIYNLYKEHLLKKAIFYLQDETLAIDAVHTSLIKIAKNINKLPPDTNTDYERAYVYKVLRYTIIDEVRKENSYTNALDIDDFDVVSDEDTPDEILLQNEKMSAIMRVISEMSMTVRDVLILRYVHCLSIYEIATSLSMNVNTVKTKLRRGTLELKEALKEKGLAVNNHG